MIVEDDFVEDEDNSIAAYGPDPVHVQFFLHYVKLSEIMGLVLSQQYGVASKGRRSNTINLTQSDVALADWLKNCPDDLQWGPSCHNFWSALLNSIYYTTLCLLHYAHMPPVTAQEQSTPTHVFYPSTDIATPAASMITSIVSALQTHGELRYAPAFIIYSLFSALIMHVYQMRSSDPTIAADSRERMDVCMKSLREVSSIWLVAKMIYALFRSIIGNKTMEERISRASGRRHIPGLQPQSQSSFTSSPLSTLPSITATATTTSTRTKPEYNVKAPIYTSAGATTTSTPATGTRSSLVSSGVRDLSQCNTSTNSDHSFKDRLGNFNITIPDTTPAPPISYERSRPQPPTGSSNINTRGMPTRTMSNVMANQHHHDIPISSSDRGNVGNNNMHVGQDTLVGNAGMGLNVPRPASPVDPPPSLSSTPAAPQIFLVTRNSPSLCHSSWENFQPNQLFPDGVGVGPSPLHVGDNDNSQKSELEGALGAGFSRNIASNTGVGDDISASMPVHQQPRMAYNMSSYVPRPPNFSWAASVPSMPAGDNQLDNGSQAVPLSFNQGDWYVLPWRPFSLTWFCQIGNTDHSSRPPPGTGFNSLV